MNSTAVRRVDRLYQKSPPAKVPVLSVIMGLPHVPGPELTLHKTEFELLDEQIDLVYQEIRELISLRTEGNEDEALEAQITEKRQEVKRLQKASAEAIERILGAPSFMDEAEKHLAEANRLLKEHHEATAGHPATNEASDQKAQP